MSATPPFQEFFAARWQPTPMAMPANVGTSGVHQQWDMRRTEQNRHECEGFRMPAHRDGSACTGAVVRNPPVKERAGDEVRTLRRALWRFDRGVDGVREARERGGQVMTGADGARALVC